jgi:hypothetical protein
MSTTINNSRYVGKPPLFTMTGLIGLSSPSGLEPGAEAPNHHQLSRATDPQSVREREEHGDQ